MNPLQIIILALKIIGILGVGNTPMPEDTNDALTMLNVMISGWNRRRWIVWHLVDIAFQSNGSQSYTIGLGQQFDVTRPDQIESAYARQNTGIQAVDYPLDILEAHEDYSDIALKSLVSFPSTVFYDSAYPIGKLFFYPIPNDNFELHVIVKETLPTLINLQSNVIFPQEYQEALIWNLAARLRPMYQLPPDPTITAMAITSLSVIRGANSQVPRLKIPAGTPGMGQGGWRTHGIGGVVEGVFTLDETGLG